MLHLKKIFHIIFGIMLLLIGLAGLILPILNGTLFVLLGLILLSFESTVLEKKLLHLSKKNKTVETWYHKLSTLMKRIFKVR